MLQRREPHPCMYGQYRLNSVKYLKVKGYQVVKGRSGRLNPGIVGWMNQNDQNALYTCMKFSKILMKALYF